MAGEIIYAPWSDEQVQALRDYQLAGYVHPFSCMGHDGCKRSEHFDGTLFAYPDGWICPCGKYKQDWAYSFMFEPVPANPLDKLSMEWVNDLKEIAKARPLTDKEQRFVELIERVIVPKYKK